jgi:peroxiredoxin Q/BCP
MKKRSILKILKAKNFLFTSTRRRIPLDAPSSLVGISPDTPAKQKKFDDKHGLGFSLLSDQDNTIAKTYGAWGEKSMYGKKYEGIIRSSLLIDEQGKVIETWYKVSPKDTVAKALKTLGEAYYGRAACSEEKWW